MPTSLTVAHYSSSETLTVMEEPDTVWAEYVNATHKGRPMRLTRWPSAPLRPAPTPFFLNPAHLLAWA